MLELQREISLKRYQKEIGRKLEVLVDGPSRRNPNTFTGRTRTGKIVIFPPVETIGELINVKIKEATPFALYGDPIPAPNNSKSPPDVSRAAPEKLK